MATTATKQTATKTAAKKPTADKTGKKFELTEKHASALRTGRAQADSVRRYLDSIAGGRQRRQSPEQLATRLERVTAQYETASALDKLRLAQEQLDIEAAIADSGNADTAAQYEAEFIQVAADYSERKGLTYAAWRQVGVPAAVLKQAGISRAS